jgi:GMP synthase (glutamine-hydrolysing)
MLKTALVIVQQQTSNPARVGERLRQMGFELDIRCPNVGDRLPPNLDGFDAVVIFGGPMSANDDGALPGIRAQLDFLPAVFEAGTPTLGICLGAQLIARALGSTVKRDPDGRVEVGYHPIVPTAEGAVHFDGPMTVFQWHREGFDLPPGATCLATGATFRNQAFRYGDRVHGVQFHPEVVRETIDLWTTKASEDLVLPGAQSREDQFTDFDRHDPAIDRWLMMFLGRIFG